MFNKFNNNNIPSNRKLFVNVFQISLLINDL